MTEIHIFTDVDMEEGSRFSLAGFDAIVFSSSKPGRDGPNEDAAALVSLSESAGVAILSDGAGGHPGGAKAAELAVRAVCASVERTGEDLENLRGAIINGFESADRAISELGTGAAATLAVIEIRGRTMRAYHAGDSMVLVSGQRGRIKWQNIPHSPVGYAVESGMLDRGAALHHEDLHLVSNLLGTNELRIELGASMNLAPRDTVLLASDGLSDNLHFDEIVEGIRKGALPDVIHRLVRLAKERMDSPGSDAPSKPDDLTLIVLRPL